MGLEQADADAAAHIPYIAVQLPETTIAPQRQFAHGSRMNAPLFRLAAGLGFLAVALGAFGAHALKTTLAANETTEVWKTAVLYHFLHVIVLLILAFLPATSRAASGLFVAGIVVFSGSLYLLALTNVKWLGAITPLGGLCFLAGWMCLVIWPPR